MTHPRGELRRFAHLFGLRVLVNKTKYRKTLLGRIKLEGLSLRFVETEAVPIFSQGPSSSNGSMSGAVRAA